MLAGAHPIYKKVARTEEVLNPYIAKYYPHLRGRSTISSPFFNININFKVISNNDGKGTLYNLLKE